MPETLSVYWHGKTMFENGVAEASTMGDGFWNINRVLVNPKILRGKGIGSKLLQELIEKIRNADGKKIIVWPGGYDDNKKKQVNFYIKNGFKKYKEGYFLWLKK